MKFHKLEVYVVDFENSGIGDIIAEIEQNRYFCMNVQAHETTDIGEWSDDHELNNCNTPVERFREYFKKDTAG